RCGSWWRRCPSSTCCSTCCGSTGTRPRTCRTRSAATDSTACASTGRRGRCPPLMSDRARRCSRRRAPRASAASWPNAPTARSASVRRRPTGSRCAPVADFIWPSQQVVDLADGVVAIVQGDGEAGVSNAGIVSQDGSAVVVDTFMFPEMADGLVTELSRRNVLPETVVITHHHVDHIGGTTRFPDARVVAHARTVETVERSGHPTPIYDGFMPAFRGRFDALEVITPEPTPAALDLPLDTVLPAFSPAHTPADTTV